MDYHRRWYRRHHHVYARSAPPQRKISFLPHNIYDAMAKSYHSARTFLSERNYLYQEGSSWGTLACTSLVPTRTRCRCLYRLATTAYDSICVVPCPASRWISARKSSSFKMFDKTDSSPCLSINRLRCRDQCKSLFGRSWHHIRR